jgi:hypothetical protein
LVGLDRDAIFQELRTAFAEAVAELRPIEAAEVTDLDIIPARVELDDEEE